LVESCREGNPEIERFDCAVFNGEYVSGDIDAAYLAKIDAQRNDANKSGGAKAPEGDGGIIGLHNEHE
jgi:amidophosphoribosyltransferase